MRIGFFVSIVVGLLVASCGMSKSSEVECSTDLASIEEGNKVVETVMVSGNCSMCEARIEKSAAAINGVAAINWSAKTQSAEITFDQSLTTLSVITTAIANGGHDTEFEKTPNGVYEELPSCCQYERK